MQKRIPVAAGLAGALLFYLALHTTPPNPGSTTEFQAKADTSAAAANNEQSSLTPTFNRIYSDGTWGRDGAGRGISGSGSSLEITRQYRSYLEDFIRTRRVKSVVDAGCGDWTFSSAIDWNGATYLGVDIASAVVEEVRQKHATSRIRFAVGDITEELPPADLLISKDVLQHLSNELVRKFIRNNLQRGKYRWVILTNDRDSTNQDVQPGGYRALDLSAPPFEVKGLVDLPIAFGNEITKVTSLLDFTQQPVGHR